MSQRKVAILGGGVGAMVTAFELTSAPNWKEHYEVTVYQLGWRLGGKGASGRNQGHAERIEEHGLHLWFGMYENAFSVMRRCYEELGRSPDEPLATVDQAFKPYPLLGVMERLSTRLLPVGKGPPRDWVRRDEWVTFIEEWQTNSEKPGTGDTSLHPWDLLGELLTLVEHSFAQMPFGANDRTTYQDSRRKHTFAAATSSTPLHARVVADVAIASATLASLKSAIAARIDRGKSHRPSVRGKIAAHHRLTYALERAAEGPHRADLLVEALDDVRAFVWNQIEQHVGNDVLLRRFWVLFDLGVSIILGVVRDDVLTKGYDVINKYDLIEWLSRWGANKLTINHGIVTGCYDFVFAYENGRRESKNLAAGVILRFMGQMFFGYRGSLAWTMSAGMGDTVFAPLFLVLHQRGVKFKFFHAVKELRLDASGQEIAEIKVERQVNLKNGTDYWPLFPVKGLLCWPSEPLYDQIENGDELQHGWTDDNYNLESSWSAWKGTYETLVKGADFDVVVLGISLGALPPICASLANPETDPGKKWRQMFAHVRTVQTLSMQLWLRPDLRALGWPGGPAVVDAYEWPYSTYADLSHLIGRENWAHQPERPGSLGYFCGALEESGENQGPAFPKKMLRVVRREAEMWLDQYVTTFWPATKKTGTVEQFNYDLLVDPVNRPGRQRMDAQYLRANIDLSERYVLSTRGSIHYRIAPGDSGYTNLVLAGDWTKTPLNTGCVEAATMSGMLATRKVRELAHDGTVSEPIAGEAAFGPVVNSERGSRFEVVGGYSGTMALLVVPESVVRSLIPSDFTLGPQKLTPKGTFPVLVACGYRQNVRLTFPRTLLGNTYAEAMIAIPFVLHGPSRHRWEHPVSYIPRFFVTSKLVATGASAMWGLDIDCVNIRSASMDQDRRSWHVQTALRQAPILSISSGAPKRFRALTGGTLASLSDVLSQPIVSRSLRGRGPYVYAQMEWNLAIARAAPVDVAVSFGTATAFVSLRATSHRVDALDAATLGAFHITTPSWRLSHSRPFPPRSRAARPRFLRDRPDSEAHHD
ncbi:MAG TPA: NAD(P)-binding protein [Polyangiaceae bacterium]|nr:NAD(P)-binding protein [Polyangiaceae bacterium]